MFAKQETIDGGAGSGLARAVAGWPNHVGADCTCLRLVLAVSGASKVCLDCLAGQGCPACGGVRAGFRREEEIGRRVGVRIRLVRGVLPDL